MHIWNSKNWTKKLNGMETRRTGLRFRYDQEVHPEVKGAFMKFARWLRSEYEFPLRVPVYVKMGKTIRTMDGENAVGSFFEPDSCTVEPYIRIATGDYLELREQHGRDNALAMILMTLAHELTHYYQWINDLHLSEIGRERQATRYANLIIDAYAMTCEHP